jgi:hypothetical protein
MNRKGQVSSRISNVVPGLEGVSCKGSQSPICVRDGRVRVKAKNIIYSAPRMVVVA